MNYTPIVNSNILKVKNPFDLLGGIEFNLFFYSLTFVYFNKKNILKNKKLI